MCVFKSRVTRSPALPFSREGDKRRQPSCLARPCRRRLHRRKSKSLSVCLPYAHSEGLSVCAVLSVVCVLIHRQLPLSRVAYSPYDAHHTRPHAHTHTHSQPATMGHPPWVLFFAARAPRLSSFPPLRQGDAACRPPFSVRPGGHSRGSRGVGTCIEKGEGLLYSVVDICAGLAEAAPAQGQEQQAICPCWPQPQLSVVWVHREEARQQRTSWIVRE